MLRWRNDIYRKLSICGPRSSGISATTTVLFRRTSNNPDRTDFLSEDLDLIRLRKASFRYEERLSCHPIELLNTALEAYLPNDPEGIPAASQNLRPGYQHTFFRPHLSARDLCNDGTDIKFLPGPQDIWKYRLWAGGAVRYHSQLYQDVAREPSASLVERVSDVRVVGTGGVPSKVFVTIERAFATSLERSSTEQPFLTEIENICFLRDVPTSLQDERVIRPPSNPKFSHVITVTRGLLFQFSALTYNAHSIHLDRAYAQKCYGARDLVVHGPLTQVLMVEFLHRALKHVTKPERCSPLVRKIEYTNLQPLYVDRPFTLCCKPLSPHAESQAPGTTSTWQVWIEKDEGAGASCAVKATVLVEDIST